MSDQVIDITPLDRAVFTLQRNIRRSLTDLELQYVEAEVVSAAKGVLEQARSDLKHAVRTWNHKPRFYVYAKWGAKGGTFEIKVGGGPDAVRVWNFVDRGTKQHIITAKRKWLRIRLGMTAKTTPGTFESRQRSAPTSVIFRPRVSHPGYVGRDYRGQVRTKYTKALRREVTNAIRRAIRRATSGLARGVK